MAINNIIHEPIRELTETGVGLIATVVLFAAWLYGSIFFADWFTYAVDPDPKNANLTWWFGISIGFIAIVLGLFIVHAIGEWVCNGLAAHGHELRPRKRIRK